MTSSNPNFQIKHATTTTTTKNLDHFDVNRDTCSTLETGCTGKSKFSPLARAALWFSLSFDSLSLFGFWYFSWWNCRPIPSLKDTDLVTMRAAKGKGAAKISKEALKPVDDGRVGKRKAAAADDKSSKRKARKEKRAKKDPNKPKRPPSAFFVFLEEFRKEFKKENPNVKGVAAVGKAGGDKWKSLSDAEKAPYEAKAAKRKAEYEKQMKAYNKKQESGADDGDEESERSRSEVNDEEDEASGEVVPFYIHSKWH
ncbi:high mobility group B protein 1-like isoform X1 [Prunus yedoensis var. nudiflora]|uniref:High mobility group B protein 1-like isoform X1 n=1 Tax=Prunus yedoensis var. nudiflora TaxID=2094558 RepID=A0A314YQD1_PRUYE|nr:high mobility group B protein 1-like isoform X1 [Prunus yedoensis var. nudiflora]